MGCFCFKPRKNDEFTNFVQSKINNETLGRICSEIVKNKNRNKSKIQTSDETELFFKLMMLLETLFKETPDYGILANGTYSDMKNDEKQLIKETMLRYCKENLNIPSDSYKILSDRFDKLTKHNKSNSTAFQDTQLMRLKLLVDLQNNDLKNSKIFVVNNSFIFQDTLDYNGVFKNILLFEAMWTQTPDYDNLIPLRYKNRLTKSQFNFMFDSYKKNLKKAFPDINQNDYNRNINNFNALHDFLVARHVSNFF